MLLTPFISLLQVTELSGEADVQRHLSRIKSTNIQSQTISLTQCTTFRTFNSKYYKYLQNKHETQKQTTRR